MTGRFVRSILVCLILAGLYGVPVPAVQAAAVIRVPGDYPDIQSALDAAVAGDTVLVSDGIYTENLVWPSTDNITLTGLNGAGHTCIDGSIEQESCIYIGNGQQGVTITGFKLTNGYGSAPTFSGSIRAGGGLLIDEGVTATVTDCTVCDNGNEGNEYSGGIFISLYSVVSVDRCIIKDNISYGIYIRNEIDSGGSVKHCLIVNNGRAGIYCQNSPLLVMNNTIARNAGPGLEMNTPWPGILNNIITENTGLAMQSMNPDTSGLLAGNDLWNNTGGDYISISLPWYDDMHIVGENGNISEDPLFIGGGPFDYHLQPDSPCIGAGHDGADIGAYPFSLLTPGDANNDNRVNALDITGTERIILLIDDETPGADANLDGIVDALDITAIEKIIVGLE